MAFQKYHNPMFLNTSEAISDGFFMGNNNVVIAYENLNLLSGNSVNGKFSFLECSYYVFKSVSEIIIHSENVVSYITPSIREDNTRTEYIIAGGNRHETNWAELKMAFLESYLFIPYKRPEKFLDTSSIPKELSELLGWSFCYIAL